MRAVMRVDDNDLAIVLSSQSYEERKAALYRLMAAAWEQGWEASAEEHKAAFEKVITS